MAGAGVPGMSEDEMQSLYQWIDEIPLSRPKRNIGRDFSDGVLAAELVAHFFPKLVELHNYSAANSVSQKMYNWSTLNQKVFKKMGFQVSRSDCEGVCNCKSGVVERVLHSMQQQVAKIKEAGALPVPKQKAKRSPPAPVRSAPVAEKRGEVAQPRRSKEAPARQGGGGRRQPGNNDDAGNNDPYAAPSRAAPRAAAPRARPAEPRPPPVHEEPVPERHYEAPAEQPAKRGFSAAGMPAAYEQAPYAPAFNHVHKDVDTEILVEKEQTINELRETVDILETKIRKLEQLVKLKDTKIQSLQGKLAQHSN